MKKPRNARILGDSPECHAKINWPDQPRVSGRTNICSTLQPPYRAWFACRSCGFVDHADRNGSRNIRAGAWELWRRGAQSTAPAPPPRQRGGAGRKRSITASDARCASPELPVPGS
ncbi:zinc ribbon domain-containing protein [Streptomyces acidicola]|uniref:zinc ribbon domain-containing protein n=1 Tax=Streptomyces acidicola TaxID=2596892 RepID=UPI003788F3DA